MKDVEQRNKKERKRTRFFSNEDIPCNLETHRQTKKNNLFLLPTNFLSLFLFL